MWARAGPTRDACLAAEVADGRDRMWPLSPTAEISLAGIEESFLSQTIGVRGSASDNRGEWKRLSGFPPV